MKTYTFTTSELKNNGKKNFVDSILGKSTTTDYSKILDDIIADSVIKKNRYLFTKPDTCKPTGSLDDFLKAASFLANYKEPKKKYNFIIGHTYHLNDNTPIIFYDDEIQIGFDVFKYSDFYSLDFINSLSRDTQKTIIDIYTNAKDLTVNINL